MASLEDMMLAPANEQHFHVDSEGRRSGPKVLVGNGMHWHPPNMKPAQDSPGHSHVEDDTGRFSGGPVKPDDPEQEEQVTQPGEEAQPE